MRYDAKTIEAFHEALEKPAPTVLDQPHVVGHAGKPAGQGPFIQILLAVSNGGVAEASFKTYGCPACVACASTVCDLVRGKTTAEAEAVDEAALVARVGELPRAKRHCLGLAVKALRDALGKASASPSGMREDG